MTVKKNLIDPNRIRTVPPEGFSWIDRRFVREDFISYLHRGATLLYFFLVTVSDARGLSFYADPTVRKYLKLNAEELTQARTELITGGLILYRYPIYQVLPLPEAAQQTQVDQHRSSPAVKREGDLMSLHEFLQLTNSKSSH